KPVPGCRLSALVELYRRPNDPPPHHPWHVGFVQNLVEGELLYVYVTPQSDDILVAAMGPHTVPCKDSGSAGTWYDPGPFSHKSFGGEDYVVAGQEEAPEAPHRCYTDPFVRFVTSEDAPGSGKLPIKVPCASTTDGRATPGVEYTIGWADPLG